MKKVFISYAHEDFQSAKRFYYDLKAIPNIAPWIDKECLLPGMKWEPVIRKTIRQSDFVALLLSQTSATKRGFFQKEVKIALDILEEFPEDQIFLLPVRLNECDLPSERLRAIHYVDMFPKWDAGLKKLSETLDKNPVVEKKYDEVISAYEYRCAVLNLDADKRNLSALANKLNDIQKFFYFTTANILPNKSAIRQFGGFKNLLVDEVKSIFMLKEYLDMDIVFCLTKYPLAFKEADDILYNYFSGPSSQNRRFVFISLDQLDNFTKKANCSLEKGITYIMISQLLFFFTTRLGYHEQVRGCIMDFCEIRSDMIRGLSLPRFCDNCLSHFSQIASDKLKRAITSMLNNDITIS